MKYKFEIGDIVEVVENGMGCGISEIGQQVTIVGRGEYSCHPGYRVDPPIGNSKTGSFNSMIGESSFKLVAKGDPVAERISNLQKELDELKLAHAKSKEQPVEQWQPKGGEWYIDSINEVSDGPSSELHRLSGREYQTKEIAHRAADLMVEHNRLLAYVFEHAPYYTPNWDNIDDEKWFVYFNYDDSKWMADYTRLDRTVGTVYMPKEVADDLANKLQAGIV